MNGDNVNTSADLAIRYEGQIRQQLLTTFGPRLLHSLWAVRDGLGMNMGDQLTFSRSRRLALATTALTEGENPDGVGIGSDDVTVQMSELGQFFAVSSKVIKRRPWKITNSHIPLLAVNWAETIDKLVQLTLAGGTNRFYSDGVATPGEIDTKALQADFDAIDAALANAFAMPLTQFQGPTDGIGTEAIQECYVVIGDAYFRRDVEAFAGFKGIETYAAGTTTIPGEYGKYRRFRFCMSQLADEGTVNGSNPAGAGLRTRNAGANTEVRKVIVLAAEAYAMVDFGAVESIAKIGYSGEGKASDALNRASTFGWTHDWGCSILDDSLMAVYYCGASA